MKETLLLVDGSSLAYRSFYAFINKPLRNSKGMNTSAVYGFVKTLNMVLNELNPDLVGIAFDLAKPTFRHKVFKEYKATRKRIADELSPQIPIIHEIIKAKGLKILEMEGLEADDIIYTLAIEGEKLGYKVVIFTFDKDLMQAVSDNIHILNMRTGGVEWFTPDAVKEKFGVPPEKIPDLLSLAGDTSDNIPGLPGVGIKTASKLIKEYGSVTEMIKRPDIVKENSIRDKLIKLKKTILTSYILAKLNPITIPFDLSDLIPSEENKEKLISIFKELEFFSFLEEMGAAENLVVKAGEVKSKEVSIIPVDYKKGIFALSDGNVTQIVYNPDELKDKIRSASTIITEDVKNLAHKLGFYPEKKLYDLSIMDYLLYPNQRGHSIQKIVQREKGIILDRNSPDYHRTLSLYAYHIKDKLLERIKEQGMLPLFERIEMPLSKVLFKMERTGILFDVPLLKKMSEMIGERLNELSERIYSIAGEKFNLRSPKQLSYILFEKLKLPAGKRKKTHYSTDAETLSRLAKDFEIARFLLKYRELEKLRSSYTDALPSMVNPQTGRIHCTFNQTVASTGRLSASEPNLQTIPIRGELGREIRKAVVAEKGYKILSCDYSQVELRILAHFTEDERLVEAFHQGRDIHSETASIIFRKPQSEITPEMRRVAKVVNFGLMYGMSAYGLSKELNISQGEAEAFIDAYFTEFRGVKEWVERTLSFVKEKGYVETLFGRRREISGSSMGGTEDYSRRAAINTPIQGTAADIIKMAMIEIDSLLEDKKTRMILQIHDELLFELSDEETNLIDEIKRIMENVVKLKVPLVVDANTGASWAEAH